MSKMHGVSILQEMVCMLRDLLDLMLSELGEQTLGPKHEENDEIVQYIR